MMRIAYISSIADHDKPLQKKRVKKKSFQQLAMESLEERRAFDKQKAAKKFEKERFELDKLVNTLSQLKSKCNE